MASGDTQRSAVVARHAERLCLVLHLHHEGEDIILWPLLLERGGAQAWDMVPKMEEQHHGIEAALEEIQTLLPAWKSTGQNGETLAAAFEVLFDRLLEHMAMEEEEILPSPRRSSPPPNGPNSVSTACRRAPRRTCHSSSA